MKDLFQRSDFSLDTSSFFRLLFENSRQTAILILSDKGTILDCNNAFSSAFDYTKEEVVGKDFSILFIEDDRKKNLPEAELSTVLTIGESVDNNFQVHKNGNYIWVRGESVLINSGTATYIVKLMLDLHEQKKVEELLAKANDQVSATQDFAHRVNAELLTAGEALLKKSKDFENLLHEKERQANFYQTILSNAADFIYSFDLQGRFTYVNQALLNLWGLKSEEVLGKTFKELGYPPDLAEKHQKQIEMVIAAKKPLRDENFYSSEQGEKYYEYIFAPIMDEQEVQGVAGTTRDITKRHQLAEALKQKNEELNRINRDLDNFSYTASHDLKAPIGNIQGLLQVLQSEMSQESISHTGQIVSMIQISLQKFQDVLQDLSDTSRKRQENPEEVRFEEIIEESKHNLQDLINKYHPVISADLMEAPSIKFPRKNLRSIVLNLISNGIKYSSPDRKPEIFIHTRKSDGQVLLEVRDNGLGIKEEEKSKVFQMYERLHYHVEGTGVGLGIVARIVDNAGGKIEIESDLGKGTTFKVYLPER